MWIPTPGWQPSSSYIWPVPIPSTEPDAAPLICVQINASWIPYVLGCLTQLTQPTTWDTTSPSDLADVLSRAQGLASIVGAAGACSEGTAGLFNGADNYLTIGPASQFNFSAGGGYSVTAWVYTAGVGSVLSQDRNTTAGDGWFLDTFLSGTNRALFAGVNNGPSNANANAGNVLFGMVASTYDGSNIRIFYNGTLIATTATSINPAYSSMQPAQIGRRGTTHLFAGAMRDVALYAGRVPDADIATIYAAGGGVSGSATLNGHWLLEEGTGTTAADSSGHGNTATWHGTPPYWGTWPT